MYRQEFDSMLYQHARECGADAREGHEVIAVNQNAPRDTLLEVRTDEGRSYQLQARYVMDASGRDTFLSAKKKLRRKNMEHQSAAIFGHFSGAQQREGRGRGQHQYLSLRSRLDVDDPTAAGRDERRCGVPA
jgi:flavin-dependent dehydrogenase